MNTSRRQQSVLHSAGSSNNPSPSIQTFYDFLVIPMMSHQAPGQHQYQSTFSARNGIAISPVAHRSLCSRLANCPGSVGCVRWTRTILWLPLGIGMVRSISESAANLRSLVGALLKPLVSHLLKPLNRSLGTASFHVPKVSWRRQKSSSLSVP